MDILGTSSLTGNFSVPVLAHGTTTTLSSTNAFNFAIRGKAYTKAALSNTATPTTDATTAAAFVALAANQGAVVLIGLDKSGNLKASQGPVQALDTSGNFILAPQFPMFPDTICPVGYIVVKAGSTASAWTFGTSNYNATGITFTPIDIALGLPDRPQVA